MDFMASAAGVPELNYAGSLPGLIGTQRKKSLRIKPIADETVPIWPYLNIYYTLQ